MREGKHRAWTWLALLAGLALRMYFVRAHAHVEGDSLVYGDLASNVLRHHVYGLTEGSVVRSTLIRMPGYPLLLTACFAVFGVGKWGAVLGVQVVMDLASCWMMGRLAERLWGGRAGMVALWLAALCPFTANYAAAPLTETPAILCVVVALFGLERWVSGHVRWRWGIGSALAAAVMLRPDRALVVVPIVGVMLLFTNRARWRDVVVVCAVVMMPVGVWTARNWRVMHVFQPLAPKYANDPGEFVSYGFSRWYRTWAVEYESTANVYWQYDGARISTGDLPARAFDSTQQREKTEALFAKYNAVSSATPEIDAQFAALAAERVRAGRIRYYFVLPAARLANMWLRPRTEMLRAPIEWWRFGLHPWASFWTAAYAGLNLGLLGMAALGVWGQRGRMGPVEIAAVVFVVLRSLMLMTIDNAEQRYTIDGYPVVLLFAAYAVIRWREATAQSSCADLF